jgi:aminoglycoside phosphotransferase (APT) family kinase protein
MEGNAMEELAHKLIRTAATVVKVPESALTLHREGTSCWAVVAGDGKLVVKFPRTQANVAGLARDSAALRLLREWGEIGTLRVPRLLEYSPVLDEVTTTESVDHPEVPLEQTYLAYAGVVGQVVGERDLPQAQQQALGQAVGEFLTWLHRQQLPLVPWYSDQHTVQWLTGMYREAMPSFQRYLSTQEFSLLHELVTHQLPADYARSDVPIVLSHGDLGPYNVIACPDGSFGVFDFDSCGHYDQSRDFLRLPPVALEAALDAYPTTPALRRRITLRQKFLPFYDTVRCQRNGDIEGLRMQIDKLRTGLTGAVDVSSQPASPASPRATPTPQGLPRRG